MNDYERLLDAASKNGIYVMENADFESNADALINGNVIGINKKVRTVVKRKCFLAEELGHHYTTAGNIIDQSKPENRKQERRARCWAFKKLVSLFDIIRAYEHGCQNCFEMAEYLEVTEEFLRETLDVYRQKYGTGVRFSEYTISFEPYLMVCKFNK